MTIKKLLALCCLSIIGGLGCANRPSPKMLVGKYCFNKFNKDSNNDSLFVNENNHYKHRFWTTNGRIFESSGKWRYDSIEQEILFEDFMFFRDEGSNLPPGNWFSKVKVADDGEVRLMYSSEDDIYFKKK
jgi:hypothetical protein